MQHGPIVEKNETAEAFVARVKSNMVQKYPHSVMCDDAHLTVP